STTKVPSVYRRWIFLCKGNFLNSSLLILWIFAKINFSSTSKGLKSFGPVKTRFVRSILPHNGKKSGLLSVIFMDFIYPNVRQPFLFSTNDWKYEPWCF